MSDNFIGYERAKGPPGIRNMLLILNLTGLTEPGARIVADRLDGAVFASSPHGSFLSRDAEARLARVMAGLARNPNAGAVLVISADTDRSDALATEIADLGKPVEFLTLEACGRDMLTLQDAATRKGAHLLHALSRCDRRRYGLDALTLGLQCGLSDPTSGLAANPVIGAVVDHVCASGGRAIMGETTEWLGLEKSLAGRATTSETGRAIVDAVERRVSLAAAAGVPLLGNNPNRANIEAGLSTIEDKALGSVAKAGTAPVAGCLDYGAKPQGSGLYLMDGPSYTPESLTGIASAGAQIAIFSTGVGNSFVSALMPTIKISGNAATAARLTEQIDLDVSAAIEGDEQAAANALILETLAVASGALTFGEILREGAEIPAALGETL